MSVPTQIGVVTVWGIDGNLVYTGLLAADNLLERISYEDGTDEHESRDKDGEVIGVKLWNRVAKLTIDFYPSKPAGGGSIAAAKANVILPAKGSKVTIAGMPVNCGVNSGSGTAFPQWVYFGGGGIEFSNNGECKMKLPLRAYNNDIAATANS
jgi:hypothetical protein